MFLLSHINDDIAGQKAMKKFRRAIKNKARRAMSAFLYLAEAAAPEKPEKNTINILWQNARNDGARFIDSHLEHAMLMPEREDIWTYAYRKANKEGLLLEFGVFAATSTNFFAGLMKKRKDPRTFYGFDSFEGIEEDWAGHYQVKHGYTRNKQLPDVRDNVELVVGWVQDSVPPFLEKHSDTIALMHIDTDTYTPCAYLLEATCKRWVKGTIILFDELHSYPGWKHGELKALNEFAEKHPEIKFHYTAFARNQAAIVVTDVG